MEEFEPTSHDSGRKKVFVDKNSSKTSLMQFAYGELDPGERIEPHKHPTMEEHFYFIEGKGNQFAKAAASSVADGPGQTPFNPLLVYSNPGLGKTHLIQAIGNHIVKHHPNLKVIYVTSEKFMLDFIYSIQNNKSTQFAQSYRKVDVLLV